MRLWPVGIFALVMTATVLGSSASLADACAALRGQMASSGRGGISPELAQLRRQLAAIQGLERQRRCTAQSATGGFFNACADLAKSRTQVQRQIAGAAISGRDTSGLQARLVALGCARRQATETASGGRHDRQQFDAVLRSPVRRLFLPGAEVDDAGVDLYTRGDPSLETEEMVALDTRKPYKDLPAAFKYRDDATFKACDVKRYSRRVAELRARTVTPANMSNAIIPLPSAKPDLVTVAQIPRTDGSTPEATGAAQQQSVEALAGSRPVRMVGPAFFPAD
ncbi:DUF2865 domain-containing protein [Mesorhizobium caraganae]|uniref:DUF2865 domain-containing protein n=1 Tax=Mesorhizobium caraganae TaxID=483206 RepID=UPI001FE9CAB1|nr:DUF2865 domain-containing protein [Mesorhizobium caraganae]